jgi:hypothetical protein
LNATNSSPPPLTYFFSYRPTVELPLCSSLLSAFKREKKGRRSAKGQEDVNGKIRMRERE